jgi:hypothetical protein
MCHQCDYEKLISGANLEATSNRVHVLEVVGENKFPLYLSFAVKKHAKERDSFLKLLEK